MICVVRDMFVASIATTLLFCNLDSLCSDELFPAIFH